MVCLKGNPEPGPSLVAGLSLEAVASKEQMTPIVKETTNQSLGHCSLNHKARRGEAIDSIHISHLYFVSRHFSQISGDRQNCLTSPFSDRSCDLSHMKHRTLCPTIGSLHEKDGKTWLISRANICHWAQFLKLRVRGNCIIRSNKGKVWSSTTYLIRAKIYGNTSKSRTNQQIYCHTTFHIPIICQKEQNLMS